MVHSNHRLQIWNQFLDRVHYQDAPSFCEGNMGTSEFNLVARYFVHSRNTVSKIFQLDTARYGGSQQLLELLNTASDEELAEYPVICSLQKFFNAYFAYVQKLGEGSLPVFADELDGASLNTKAMIRKFAKRFQGQIKKQLIKEMWMCSFCVSFFYHEKKSSVITFDKLTS